MPDRIKVEVRMERYEFGSHITIPGGAYRLTEVPFTLGPWSGKAVVTSGTEMKFDEFTMTLEFEMELLPVEQLTIAQALVEFYGAEIVE